MTMPALIRATEADVADIRALSREAYAKWVPIVGREPLPMLADYDAAIREHRFDLVRDGPGLVALIETAVQREAEGDHLLIVNVAVAPAAQGRGIGRLLMEHAEGLARAAGVDELRLYTNKKMEGNVALYLRLGYRVFWEEPWPPAGARLHMSKRLEAIQRPMA